MATKHRRKKHSLSKTARPAARPLRSLLFEEPAQFEFFQAVRLLELLDLSRQSIGEGDASDREAAFLRGHPSLAFHGGEVADLCEALDAAPPELTVARLGLISPLGTLPLAYTELLLERLAEGDRALLDFLDQLHHAALAPLYRAWAETHPGIAYERWQNAQRQGIDAGQVERLRAADTVTQQLLDLAGVGTAALRPRGLRAETFAFYAGLFAQQPRPAVALEALLSDYFAVPIEAISCAGSAANQFRLRLGPLDEDRYRSFLPGGDALPPLLLLTRWFVGPDLDFDVLLTLARRKAAASCILSETERGARLGWTSWLRDSEEPAEEDAILIPLGQCREVEQLARAGPALDGRDV